MLNPPSVDEKWACKVPQETWSIQRLELHIFNSYLSSYISNEYYRLYSSFFIDDKFPIDSFVCRLPYHCSFSNHHHQLILLNELCHCFMCFSVSLLALVLFFRFINVFLFPFPFRASLLPSIAIHPFHFNIFVFRLLFLLLCFHNFRLFYHCFLGFGCTVLLFMTVVRFYFGALNVMA